MNIAIARNGHVIANGVSTGMIQQGVNDGSIHPDDHALPAGETVWITVAELLSREGISSITVVENSEIQTAEVGEALRLEQVVRSAPSKSRLKGKRHFRGWVYAFFFIGIAAIIFVFAWSQRPPSAIPKGNSTAFRLAEEGNDFLERAEPSFWKDHEEHFLSALARFTEAWRLIHGGEDYPNGTLSSHDSQTKVLRDELKHKIEKCIRETDKKPWPF